MAQEQDQQSNASQLSYSQSASYLGARSNTARSTPPHQKTSFRQGDNINSNQGSSQNAHTASKLGLMNEMARKQAHTFTQ